MKKEYFIERQGRSFVLYAGLLDTAHEKGLKSITTELLQAPSAENGETTICRATVEMGDGRVFTGIGDATPQNVGRNIVPHAIRMAETRSKARALRDAINVGSVALEELGDLDEPEQAGASGGPATRGAYRTSNGDWEPVRVAPRAEPTARSDTPTPIERARAAAPNRPPASGVGRDDLATPAQVRVLYLIGRDQHSLSGAEVDERALQLYGVRPAELSKRQASTMITALKGTGRPASS